MNSYLTENSDLDNRHALRRVPGLSTELDDVTEVEYRQLRLEQVIVVGVWTSGTATEAADSLAELASLARTAGSVVLDGLIQRRSAPDPSTYIGSGKAQELHHIVATTGADTVICDGELSPGQLRQLEGIVRVKVVDRTALILDIFAQHASSKEGKAQIELAQLHYMLPRLRGWGQALSRTGGGIGTRGPGETKIETDRRRIRHRISILRRAISRMESSRTVERASRRKNAIPSVVLAGYTNAGKSSLLNTLTGAHVLTEDALFATVDPTVRRMTTATGRQYTLTDTVGFIRHLPHQLVDAFHSTLSEVKDADLIVHVVDATHPDPAGQLSAVHAVLSEIGAMDVPELVVINKIDATIGPIPVAGIEVSAHSGFGLDQLKQAITDRLPEHQVHLTLHIPYTMSNLVEKIRRYGTIISLNHDYEGTQLHVRVDEDLAAQLVQFSVG